MTSPLKSELLNSFKEQLIHLEKNYINRCSSQYDFRTKNKKKFEEQLNSSTNFAFDKNAKELDSLLSNHFLAFYELRDYFIGISLNFSNSFKDLSELKDDSYVSLEIHSKYKENNKDDVIYKTMRYSDFELSIENYLYILKFVSKYNLFDNGQNNSPHKVKFDFFVNLFMKEHNDTMIFIQHFKNREDIFSRVFEKKFLYTSKRREANKRRKDEKKNNKSKKTTQVKENEDKIRDLKRQISQLEKANENIKKYGNPNATNVNDEKKEIDSLRKSYLDSANFHFESEFKSKTNKEYLDLFIHMVEI